jgi:hypothetical protein
LWFCEWLFFGLMPQPTTSECVAESLCARTQDISYDSSHPSLLRSRSPSPSYAHFISNMKNMSPFSLAAQPANETRFPNYGFLFPSYECAHIFISRSCQQ